MICSGSASHQLFQNDFRLRAKSLKRVGPIPPPPIPSLGRFCHEALRCPHFGSPDSRIELWLLWLPGFDVRHAERWWLLPALRRRSLRSRLPDAVQPLWTRWMRWSLRPQLGQPDGHVPRRLSAGQRALGLSDLRTQSEPRVLNRVSNEPARRGGITLPRNWPHSLVPVSPRATLR